MKTLVGKRIKNKSRLRHGKQYVCPVAAGYQGISYIYFVIFAPVDWTWLR
jgi:hypothetical protein